jgi:hypothetical protein
MSNLLDKALQTNSTQNFLDIAAEPDFNKGCIEKRIAELEKEIKEMQHQAFCTKVSNIPNGLVIINNCPFSGVDIEDLQAKQVLLASLK